MNRWFPSLALLACAAPAFGQLPPDKALASLKVADGLQVELFAAEPMVINPTSMDIDHKGRVWITEAVNYRRLPPYNRPILRPEGDRIQVLVDETGGGKATKAVTFYQGKEIYGPLSVCVLPQPDGALRVLVAQSPDILEFWDRDGDLKADGPPTKFLSGFGGFDHDHGVHGLSVGPDGKLYFTVGDQGVTGLQSKDGKGRKWVTTRDPQGDCQAGTVWRCDLDGNNLELIAHNFRNNYECCVDSFGEIWLSDNDDDGNQQTRICHVMPGGNYGYWPRGPGQTHWHEEQPGIVHKTLRTGFGSPTGICFYEGTLLPEKYRGQLLHTDAGPRELRAFLRKPKGAGYELEKVDLLTSTDTWFRLSDVCVAPDGSVFVCDWYDPGVGGHGMGDWTRGRVYRLTPKGHRGYKVPEVKLDTKEGVLAALGSPCLATRAMAILALETMPASQAVTTLKEGLRSQSDDLKARALQHYVTTMRKLRDGDEVAAAAEALGAFMNANQGKDSPFDVLSTRIVTRLQGQPFPADLPYKKEVVDPALPQLSKALLREQLLGLRNDPDPEHVKPFVLNFAKVYDGQDHFYRAALNIACGTDPARRDAILADFDKHFPEWNDKVADLVWELRPKSVLPRLDRLLADPKLTAAQKGRVVDILAVNDDPAAGKTLLALLAGDAPPEVKARALASLSLFLPTKWKGLSQSGEMKSAIDRLLKDKSAAVTALRLVSAANDTTAIAAVSEIVGDDGRPANVRTEAVRTLGSLSHPKAVEELSAVIAFAREASLAREGVLALGAQAARGSSAPAKQALAVLEAFVAANGSTELRLAAVSALAGTRAGTNWLLQQKEQSKLPADLVADAGRLLRNSPFQGERNKAMLLFPAPGKLNVKALPSPAILAKRKGNAETGKAIMARSTTNEAQCLKCHTVRGIGGQIGPDLSMIGKKGSRENLFESILQPSKAIADQYVSWKIDTVDGQSITGLLVGETPQAVTLRDANGKDYAVPVKDIDKRTKSLVSLMPDNLAAALTEDELVDVVEYLTTLQTAALTPEWWWIVGPFHRPGGNAALNHVHGPEKAPFAPKATFPEWNGPSSGPKAKDLAWQQVRTAASGYLDLAALHGNAAAESVSFAYCEIESPADQDAEVLLGSDDGAKLWVNGKDVLTEKVTRAAAPGQNTVAVKLKKGTNAVLLKVANGGNPHGFYLTVLSPQELKAK